MVSSHTQVQVECYILLNRMCFCLRLISSSLVYSSTCPAVFPLTMDVSVSTHSVLFSHLSFNLETFIEYLLFASTSARHETEQGSLHTIPRQRGRAFLWNILELMTTGVTSHSTFILPMHFHNTIFLLTRWDPTIRWVISVKYLMRLYSLSVTRNDTFKFNCEFSCIDQPIFLKNNR